MLLVHIASLAAMSLASWLPADLESAYKCMPDPLPRVPISYLSHGGEKLPIGQGSTDLWKFTVQRMPCADGTMPILLFADNQVDYQVQFVPAGHMDQWRLPTLCADRIRLRQNGQTFMPQLYAGAPRHATPLCSRITRTVTTLMHVPADSGFDPAEAFEVEYVQGNTVHTAVSVPDWPGGVAHSDWLTPHDSGHYFNPERGGQGIFILASPTREGCSTVGGMFSDCDHYSTFLVFFGYDDDGKQLWLTAGTSNTRRDQIWQEADVVYTRGGRFGYAHDAEMVERTRWGSVRWRIHGCHRLEAHYTRADGLTGTWDMVRGVGQTTGYSQCGDPDRAAVE